VGPERLRLISLVRGSHMIALCGGHGHPNLERLRRAMRKYLGDSAPTMPTRRVGRRGPLIARFFLHSPEIPHALARKFIGNSSPLVKILLGKEARQ
jgi:hypothetical protein